MFNKPVYHFAPATNWMNDPNATIYCGGEYHLFYQYNPKGSSWGNICWAYATSRDLINWQRKGIRLSPETEKEERYCFSGCAAEDKDGFIISYTSIGFEDWAIQQHARQRFCRANADFTHIERLYDKDLTVKAHPFGLHEWRDPFIFYYSGKPYLLLCGIRWSDGKSENSILLYESKNGSLTDWEFVSVLFVDPDNIIECPNMAVFDDGRMALIYSTMTDRKVKYVAGDFDGKRFWERCRGVVDWSLNSFYATNLSKGANGEHILYGWLGENLSQGDSPDGKYSGCLAAPRVMSMDKNYRLHFEPVKAFQSLEVEELAYQNGEVLFDGVQARLTLELMGEGCFTLTDGERQRLTVRVRSGEVIVSRISAFPSADLSQQRMSISPGQKHSFDILIDGSVTEIFADGMHTLSIRQYRADKPDKLFSLKDGKVSAMRAVKLKNAEIIGE